MLRQQSIRQKPKGLKQFSFSLLSSSTLISGMLLPSLSLTSPAMAVQFPNGEVAFNSPPHLISATVSSNGRDVPAATYFFTLKVPENAGEPLRAIQIKQAENAETVEFVVEKSNAFHGSWRAQGESIPLASVGGTAPTSGEATVVFERPVAPGSIVTVALQARRNPRYSGVYMFGVTAFPQGQASRGQFLGFGRMHFYGD